MIEILLYSTLSCSDADAIMLRMKNNENLNNEVRIELIEVMKESSPDCYWDAHD
jgi:uncharacterized OsmC-like protein